MSRSPLHGAAAVVGVGHSGCFKFADEPEPRLWIRAVLEAIEDAGLSPNQIDGLSALNMTPVPGAAVPNPMFIAQSLGLPGVNWHAGALGGAYATGVLASCAAAVASGQCDYAVGLHNMSSGPKQQALAGGRPYGLREDADGQRAFTAPYGYSVFLQYLAAYQQRIMSLYGITREQIGRMVVDQRAGAVDNPLAVFRTPLTLDDYLESRMIADPMCLYDCDMPVDAAAAYVVTSAERAADLRHPPVKIAHAQSFMGGGADFIFHYDYTELFPKRYAERFWRMADFSPADLDCAMLHDGFSIYTLMWLESLGIVPKGESGEFAGAGELSRTGSLPLNTHGGNLSEGRFQGGGHVVEAVRQLRGTAGPRQLDSPRVCVISSGGTPTASAAVLFRD